MLEPGPRAQQAWGRGHEVKGKLGVGGRLGVSLRKGTGGRELPLGGFLVGMGWLQTKRNLRVRD